MFGSVKYLAYICKKIKMKDRLLLKEKKDNLIIKRPDLIILDVFYDYEIRKIRCKFICSCGNESVKNYSNILQNEKCLLCSGKRKLSFEKMVEVIKERNPGVFLINEFRDPDVYKIIYVTYKCTCGNIATCLYQTLRGGGLCGQCAGDRSSKSQRLTIEEVKKKLEIINPKIKILSNDYINSGKKLDCECQVCGNKWGVTWGNLSQGMNCPECKLINQRGENHHNWRGGTTVLNDWFREQIRSWKVVSFKKYDSKCDITNKKLKTNIIHHLHNFSDITKEVVETLGLKINRFEIDYTFEELENMKNLCVELHYKYGLGVCLSEKEHKLFHKTYGIDNNTPEQYYEFKQMRLKELKQK